MIRGNRRINTGSTVTVADESTDTTCFVLFTTGATGDLPPKSGSNLTFNSSSGILEATGFTGDITGDITGNADTATVLQTARTIGGVSFNGSASINLPGVNIAGNQNTSGSAATLTTARDIGGVSFNGSASINLPGVNIAGNQDTSGTADNADVASLATTVTVTANNTTDETVYPVFVDGTTGTQGIESDTGLTYNPSSGLLTATAFAGDLTGDLTGNADTATVATTVTITDNESTAEDNVITFAAGAAGSGNVGLEADGHLTYNPSTGKVTATGFIGALTGNASGSSGSCTGLAATATALASARNINGVSFDGTGNITVTAAGSTLSDAVPNGNLANSSITINGSAIALGASVTTANTMGSGFVLEDGDGTEVTVTENKEVKFIGAGGLTVIWTDTSHGTDGDPYDLTFTIGTLDQNTTGSAATLTTARNIGGVSFNGSASIDLPGVNAAGNQNTSGLAGTATALASARTIGGTSFDGTANIAVALSGTATALASARTIGGTSFDGTANIAVALATLATTVTVVANNTADETVYPVFVDGASGTQGVESDTGLTYNPSSGLLTALGFAGALTGNASGSSGSCTGLAATATALATARAINGVSFDGTGAITVTAAGSTLSDAVPNGKLANSSITINGSAIALGASVTTANTMGSGFVLEDGDATEVTVTENKEVKFIGAGGLTVIWTDTSHGTDGDPYDLTFTIGTLNQNTTGSAATLTTARNIGGVSFNGSAPINLPGVNATGNQNTSGTAALATAVTVTANNTANETVYPVFVDGATGTQGVESDTGLTYNPSSGLLTALGLAATITTATQGTIDHDSLANFVANEHIDHSGVSVTAGAGLTGGGTIAATITLNVVGGDGITANANDIAITAAQTTVISMKHNSLVIGGNSQNNCINFSTDDAIISQIDESEIVRVNARGISYPIDSEDLQTFSLNAYDTSGDTDDSSSFRITKYDEYGNNQTYCYFNGTVTNSSDMTYFTGQHGCIPSDTSILATIGNYVGMIVSSSGSYNSVNLSNEQSLTGKNGITINDSVPIVSLSTIEKDKKVFGVISNSEDSGDTTRTYGPGPFHMNVTRSDTRLYINSLGEGAIWVTNYNGNLVNGDYITTSPITGYGMKQGDDLLHNYTVGKITMDCDFNISGTDYTCVEFTHNSVSYRRSFVGCTYHCG